MVPYVAPQVAPPTTVTSQQLYEIVMSDGPATVYPFIQDSQLKSEPNRRDYYMLHTVAGRYIREAVSAYDHADSPYQYRVRKIAQILALEKRVTEVDFYQTCSRLNVYYRGQSVLTALPGASVDFNLLVGNDIFISNHRKSTSVLRIGLPFAIASEIGFPLTSLYDGLYVLAYINLGIGDIVRGMSDMVWYNREDRRNSIMAGHPKVKPAPPRIVVIEQIERATDIIVEIRNRVRDKNSRRMPLREKF